MQLLSNFYSWLKNYFQGTNFAILKPNSHEENDFLINKHFFDLTSWLKFSFKITFLNTTQLKNKCNSFYFVWSYSSKIPIFNNFATCF